MSCRRIYRRFSVSGDQISSFSLVRFKTMVKLSNISGRTGYQTLKGVKGQDVRSVHRTLVIFFSKISKVKVKVAWRDYQC